MSARTIDKAELTEVRQIAEERIAKFEQAVQSIEKRQATQRHNLAIARQSSGEQAREAVPLLELIVDCDQRIMLGFSYAARELREALNAR